MKRFLLSALFLTALAGLATAQIKMDDLKNPNDQSPNASTSVTIGGKTIWIFYHAPSARNRKIFGGADALQPDGSIWRLGADYATVLHTDFDLDLSGVAVPKGDYTLYADLDKGQWKLIVNKTLMAGGRHIWGINMDGTSTNNAATEVGRVAMTMGKPAKSVETMKITLSNTGMKGKILVEFADKTAAVPFTAK
jgi:hypothetical protein